MRGNLIMFLQEERHQTWEPQSNLWLPTLLLTLGTGKQLQQLHHHQLQSPLPGYYSSPVIGCKRRAQTHVWDRLDIRLCDIYSQLFGLLQLRILRTQMLSSVLAVELHHVCTVFKLGPAHSRSLSPSFPLLLLYLLIELLGREGHMAGGRSPLQYQNVISGSQKSET